MDTLEHIKYSANTDHYYFTGHHDSVISVPWFCLSYHIPTFPERTREFPIEYQVCSWGWLAPPWPVWLLTCLWLYSCRMKIQASIFSINIIIPTTAPLICGAQIPVASELSRRQQSHLQTTEGRGERDVSLLGVPGPLICVGSQGLNLEEKYGSCYWHFVKDKIEKLVHSSLLCGFCLIGSKHGRDVRSDLGSVVVCDWNSHS